MADSETIKKAFMHSAIEEATATVLAIKEANEESRMSAKGMREANSGEAARPRPSGCYCRHLVFKWQQKTNT